MQQIITPRARIIAKIKPKMPDTHIGPQIKTTS